MSVQLSLPCRNNSLDSLETSVGTNPVLKIRTGSPPVNCAAADTGTPLISIDLPSDWMAAASNGSKSKLGAWASTGLATGTAGHFRIYASNGTTCHIQGTVGMPGSGSDMELDNTSIAINQNVSITNFTLSDQNG